MKVKTLRARLADAPDDADVVVSAGDHGYRRVSEGAVASAELTSQKTLHEYHGDEHMAPKSKRVLVFWIG